MSRGATKETMPSRGCCAARAWKTWPSRKDAVPIPRRKTTPRRFRAPRAIRCSEDGRAFSGFSVQESEHDGVELLRRLEMHEVSDAINHLDLAGRHLGRERLC